MHFSFQGALLIPLCAPHTSYYYKQHLLFHGEKWQGAVYRHNKLSPHPQPRLSLVSLFGVLQLLSMLIILEPVVWYNQGVLGSISQPQPLPRGKLIVFHSAFPVQLLFLLFIQGFQKLSSIIWAAIDLSTTKCSTLASISCLKIFLRPVLFNNHPEGTVERGTLLATSLQTWSTCKILSLISKNSIINFKDSKKECSSLVFCCP